MSYFGDHHPLGEGIDRSLAALPGDFAVAAAASSRLVIGPPGAFVLEGSTTDRLDITAARVAGLAVVTRGILADHVAWVPFVDGLVVVADPAPTHPSVTVVPGDLLTDTLTQGPEVVTPTILGTVHRLLREASLGVWRLGPGMADEQIDLSEPAHHSSTP